MGVNRFKEALRAGRPQIGLWCSLGSPVLAEIIADAGYDWLLLDTEHAPNEAADVLMQMQAIRGAPGEAIVRPPWNDAVAIKRLMDVGARTLLIPMVQNEEEAARAVAATRYPPAGIRGVASMPRASGYGRTPDYHRNAAEEACVLVQIETRAALARIEAIASVDGIEGLFIGPSDLAADLGHLGQPGHPEVQAAIADAGRRILAAGKPAGILTGIEAEALRCLEMGFTFVAVGSDLGLLASACSGLLGRMRQARD